MQNTPDANTTQRRRFLVMMKAFRLAKDGGRCIAPMIDNKQHQLDGSMQGNGTHHTHTTTKKEETKQHRPDISILIAAA
jgi:hypothetical protein